MAVKKKKKPTKKKQSKKPKRTTSSYKVYNMEKDKTTEEASHEIIVMPVTDTRSTGGKIEEGTAVIEPPFKIFQNNRLIVKAMDFKGAHKGLLQVEELQEQIVEINYTIEGYPLDIIVQVNRALQVIHGFSHARERISFWGAQPPLQLDIATGVNSSEPVAYGEMAPPAWEGGSIDMSVNMRNPLSLSLIGTVRRKYEPEVKRLVNMTRDLMKKASIYRNKPVKLDLKYVKTGAFDPTSCAPEFMDVERDYNLILVEKVERQLNTHLWNVIRKPNNYREDGVPIRQGFLLVGPHGTGKTLTLYVTARIATQCNFTYLYLEGPITPETFITGYKLAQQLSPSIYAIEDCDILFGRDRDAAMSALFEQLDGISSKNKEVIVIYTSNHPDKLHPGFRRGGRVDHEMKFTAPDAKAAVGFVKLNLGEFLAPDVDFEKVGEACANLVQSEITNICDSAKKYHRGDSDGTIIGKVKTEDLILAAEEIREKVQGDKPAEDPTLMKLKRVTEFGEIVSGPIRKDIQVLQEDMVKVKKAVRAS